MLKTQEVRDEVVNTCLIAFHLHFKEFVTELFPKIQLC